MIVVLSPVRMTIYCFSLHCKSEFNRKLNETYLGFLLGGMGEIKYGLKSRLKHMFCSIRIVSLQLL